MLADLDSLRTTLGTLTNANNTSLTWALNAAISDVRARVYAEKWDDADTQYAVLLKAARLYKARFHNEGSTGWVDTGFHQLGSILGILADDPIEAGLLEHKIDMRLAGVA